MHAHLDTDCALCRYDQSYVPYGFVLCIFQLYRAFLLPFANTWMLYSLIGKLELKVSIVMCYLQSVLLCACFVLPTRTRAALHIPVQLVSVSFSASVASRLCPASTSLTTLSVCIGSVLSAQHVMTMAVPIALAMSFQEGPCRSFVPHVQAKRSLFQP